MPFKTVWTDDKLQEEAKKYSSRQEFRKGARSAYVIARNKGDEYCDKLCSHMIPSNRNTWTIDHLCATASKYGDRKSFRLAYPSGHSAGQRLGVLHIMYAHMKRNGGFDILAPAIMYYLKINKGEAYKIGVTNATVELRFKLKDLKKIEVLKVWEFSSGREALDKELEIKKDFIGYRWRGRDILTNGNTELFNSDILLIDN